MRLDKISATQAIVSAARPTLVTDGVDVTNFLNGTTVMAFVGGSVATALTAPTSGTTGVEVWGYQLGQWWLAGALHGGDEIDIAGVAQGFSQVMSDIDLSAFSRLAIACTVASGNATARFGALWPAVE